MDAETIGRAAAIWRDCGVRHGEAVAIGLADRAEARLACLGVASAGGVAVIVEADLPVQQLEMLWQRAAWRFLLAESRAERPAAMRDFILTRAEWLQALEDACPVEVGATIAG